jgi:energy-coupling factor transport system permease protein
VTHPLRWFAWIAAAAVATMLTRNPFYQVLLFGIALLLVDSLQRVQLPDEVSGAIRESRLPFSPLRFALFAVPAGALFNGLTSPFGDTVVVRLPSVIPYLGGPITVEAMAYGAINGLILATLFSVFAVLNLAVPVRDLIGYLPRAFYPVAVVSAIAVTFVPGTLRQFRQVREAQAVRGHRMRGLRDWLPLFMPVLIGGLERALQMAEAMTARGFAASRQDETTRAVPAGPLISVLGMLLVLAGGVLRLVPGGTAGSPVLLLAGMVLMGGAIWHAGRGVRFTRYHRARWTWTDTATAVAAVGSLIPLLLWPISREYNPYLGLSWPQFDVRIGAALLGFVLPVLLLSPGEGASASGSSPPDRRELNDQV